MNLYYQYSLKVLDFIKIEINWWISIKKKIFRLKDICSFKFAMYNYNFFILIWNLNSNFTLRILVRKNPKYNGKAVWAIHFWL